MSRSRVQLAAVIDDDAVLDSSCGEIFDNITRFIAGVCNVPVACIGLVDRHGISVKSVIGLEEMPYLPRELARCKPAISNDGVIEIRDLRKDPRFTENPLVTETALRFCASIPLVNPKGQPLGIMAVLDYRSRSLTRQQKDLLKQLVTVVSSLFDTRKSLAQTARFGFILDHSCSEILVVEPKTWRFVYANASAQKNLQYSVEEFNLLTPARLNSSFDTYQCKRMFSLLRSGERNQVTFETELLRRDQSVYPVEVRLQRSNCGGQSLLIAFVNDISRRIFAEQSLFDSEEMNRRVLLSSSDCIKVLGLDGQLLSINDPGQCLMEIDDVKKFIGKSWIEFWPNPRHAEVRRAIELAKAGSIGHFAGYCPTAAGTPKWWDVRITAVLNRHNQPHRLVAVSRDITQLKQTQDALHQEKDFAESILASIADAVITTNNEGNVNYINPVAEHLTGWPAKQARGLPIQQIFHIVDETTRESVENPVDHVLREGMVTGLADHTVLISRTGIEYVIEDSAAPILTAGGEYAGAVLVFHDVTSARHLADRLSYEASHDMLTGLMNRKEFEKQIKRALDAAKSTHDSHILLYLDLDQFKVVNDACGHLAGDELLRQIARLLGEKMRQSDLLARLGGDEFAAILEGCSLEQGQRLAYSVLEAVRKFRFTWQGKIFRIGVSIGLVSMHRDSLDVESALGAADTACFLAKSRGRNRVQVFQPADVEVVRHHREIDWVSRIHRGIEDHRFVLFHQKIYPVHCPQAEDIEHHEILLRLRDEKGNLIAPVEFIPAAERYNLMPAIDRWVLETVFSILGQTGDFHSVEIPRDCRWSINLSGTSINSEDFLEFAVSQLRNTSLQPHSVCFEITETAAIGNLKKAVHFMRTMKDMGCFFSLDDFGSGLSSFAYLKNLPVDYLKIDGGFVKSLSSDPIDAVMVDAINRVGHAMGLKTIAEFVEDQRILEQLRRIGVDYAQGFGIHKPQPLFPGEAERR